MKDRINAILLAIALAALGSYVARLVGDVVRPRVVYCNVCDRPFLSDARWEHFAHYHPNE